MTSTDFAKQYLWNPTPEEIKEFWEEFFRRESVITYEKINPYKPGDKVELLKDYHWFNGYKIDRGTILEVFNIVDDIWMYFKCPNRENLYLQVDVSSVKLHEYFAKSPVDTDATHPCYCTLAVIWDKGCQCGGR